MTELKPCPFCGGEAYIEEESDSFSTVQYVARCKNCLVDVRIDADMTKSFEYNRQKAIEKWNNRWMIPCEEGETEGNWHTGTPTENGLYIIAYRYSLCDEIYYAVLEWEGIWKDSEMEWDALKVVDLAWQKIEPFVEEME